MSRKVVWRIIEEFKREVVEEGGRFIIVHLPTKKPIKRLRNRQHLKYQNFLEELKANYSLIDPSPELIRKAEISSLDGLFSGRSSHYSKIENRVIGEVVANALLAN